MNFGQALEALKEGSKVARAGWNGKGMHVQMVESVSFGYKITVEKFFIIKTVRETFNTWVPSVSDIFADDWEIVGG